MTTGKTVWLMEDEEELQDLCDVFQEARDEIDARVPRVGDEQTRWILQGDTKRWFLAHDTWFWLNRELEDDREAN